MILISSFFSLGVKADLVPKLSKVNQTFNYEDDMSFEHMLKAIRRQEKYFQTRSLSEKIKFGSRNLTRKHLQKSLLSFKKYVIEALNCFQLYPKNTCTSEFSRKMNLDFEVYKPVPLSWEKGYKEGKTFYTAYYSPDFDASFTKTAIFKNPIYAKPKSPKLQKLTSDAINYQNKLKGHELIYVKKSLYDIWLLHVEGGGRARVKQADGSYKYRYLSYDGANGKSFAMLYEYMIKQGMLKKGEATIAKQREYFVNHPKDQRAILKTCPSFIFFKITEDEPLGVHNIPLTENRSLATDYRRLKEYGIINFVRATKPVIVNDQVSQKPYSRFFLNQDTGGAIKGNARSDLYFGYGDKAELAANFVYGLGEQYFLILK
jgi:membrane-bound lytic murein transglycosylase A